MRPRSPSGGSDAESTPNPERLTEGQFGRLLRDGNRELAAGLDQAAAFRRLSERLSTSHATFGSRRMYWLAPAMLLLAAAFASLPKVARQLRSEAGTVIAAEELRGRAQPVASTLALADASATPPTQPTTRLGDSRAASGSKRTQPTPSAGASVSGTSSSAPASVVSAPLVPENPTLASEVGAGPDCLSLARGGKTRDAEACFLKRAEGSGLSAEMALYEVARLRRDVLGDAAGALRVLAEYRTRFPAGSLRREADMSQLELLLQLGRTDEALKQSEELLSSSASGERAAELRLLRGHILRKMRSFAAAASEYGLAERAGARRGDVIYFRALCLEALGQGPEAAALFAQYLEQPQHSHAEDARRRLERLKP